MDYWKELDLHLYDSYEAFLDENNNPRIIMATTKALHTYCDFAYAEDDFIMFGKESAGIPESILKNNRDHCVRIPMIPGVRSLNLSNAVAIVLFEGLRQQGFAGLEHQGALHRSSWAEA